MESQVTANDARVALVKRFKQEAPEFMELEYTMLEEAYKEGALSSKMKRLISLGIALRAGCTNCILAQTQHALDAGATKEEIVETLLVEIAMSGTTGIAESLRVIQFLDELGTR